MNLIREIWQSIVRRDPLSTDKGKSELVFLNVWLHIHPAKVKKEHLRFRYTFYLGFITFFLFVILVTTGIALMCYYRPYPPQAYQDMKDLRFVVFMGPFLRNMHRWAAHAMVVCVFLHMCRVFYTGSYKKPRQFNWVIGVLLLLLTWASLSRAIFFLGISWPTGPLRWGRTSAAMLRSSAARCGRSCSAATRLERPRCSASTCSMWPFCPSFVILLTIVHFWRIRKDGGLSRPTLETDAHKTLKRWSPSARRPRPRPSKPLRLPSDKTYGLMEVVTGKPIFETVTPEEEEDAVFSYPYAFFREAIALMVTVTGIMAVSLFYNAPLEALANPAKTPNPAKAPWYFLGLQELVSHSALLGGVVAPTLMVLALLAIPYFDRNPSRRPSDRKWAIWLFTIFVVANLALIVIGTFFRGPGWAFVPPWVHVATGAE